MRITIMCSMMSSGLKLSALNHFIIGMSSGKYDIITCITIQLVAFE